MAEDVPSGASCVWVRLVKNDEYAKVAVDKVELVPSSIRLSILGGPRPPSSGSAVRMTRATENGPAFLMDTWHSGLESASTSFDLGPAFDDPGEARDWITGAAGRPWAEAALNYFLLMYSPVTVGDRLEHQADLAPTPDPPKALFPLGDWDPVLYKSITAGAAARNTVLDKPINLRPASTFGAADDAVLAQLRTDAAMRPTSRRDIDFEAQGLDQVTFCMLGVVGLSTDRPVNPALKRLRDLVLDTILPVLWFYKLRDPQEPRPRQLDRTFKAEFERPHWRNPGHPSFPGGHATVVYTWAHLLASAFTGSEQALFDKARDIAHRRVIAGLHFPRDNIAGQELGRQIAEAILQAIAERPADPSVQPFADGMVVLRSLAAEMQT